MIQTIMRCPRNPGPMFGAFETLRMGIKELWEAKTYLADLPIGEPTWLLHILISAGVFHYIRH